VLLVDLVPDEAVPAMAAAMRPSLHTWAERDLAADAETAPRSVIARREQDVVDAVVAEVDFLVGAVQAEVALENARVDFAVIAVTDPAVLGEDLALRLAQRDVADSMPLDESRGSRPAE
jgi:hypothetical protein